MNATSAHASPRFAARNRGQVMVLGCVALIITALMLMASFTVSNAIHEKVRLQSHADATAYSMAVVEARAFNTIAYYNRAIAAALVAQMSLHSWNAIASNDVAMLNSGMIAMFAIAALEIAMGCYPWNISHCPCVIAAFKSALRFRKAYKKWGNTLKGLESQFDKGVEGLVKMVQSLHRGQIQALKLTKVELAYGLAAGSVKNKNAPKSSFLPGLVKLNFDQFTCALEGTDMDQDCPDNSRSKSSLATRSKVMQSSANASRPMFDRMGPLSSLISHKNFAGPMDPDVPKNAVGNGNWMHYFMTRARVGEGTGTKSNNGHQAANVGAGTSGIGGGAILNFRHVPFMPFVYSAKVISGETNAHTPGAAHQGRHNKFEWVMKSEPCDDKSCFVNFNALADPDKDFGQPSVYAGAKQSLRMRTDKDGQQWVEGAPWELNNEGQVTIKMDKTKEAKLQLIPRGEGMAIAKAKVYFHQMGAWKVAPNFFDPFWRAKLHYFKRDEMSTALSYAGDATGVMLHQSGAPVEGEDR